MRRWLATTRKGCTYGPPIFRRLSSCGGFERSRSARPSPFASTAHAFGDRFFDAIFRRGAPGGGTVGPCAGIGVRYKRAPYSTARGECLFRKNCLRAG